MKRSIGILLVVVLLVGFFLSFNAVAGSESKMHIRFSTWHPPMAREVKENWIPMLEELKKGAMAE